MYLNQVTDQTRDITQEVPISELPAALHTAAGYCGQIERNLAATPDFRPVSRASMTIQMSFPITYT